MYSTELEVSVVFMMLTFLTSMSMSGLIRMEFLNDESEFTNLCLLCDDCERFPQGFHVDQASSLMPLQLTLRLLYFIACTPSTLYLHRGESLQTDEFNSKNAPSTGNVSLSS